jgi:hypothetical protein
LAVLPVTLQQDFAMHTGGIAFLRWGAAGKTAFVSNHTLTSNLQGRLNHETEKPACVSCLA